MKKATKVNDSTEVVEDKSEQEDKRVCKHKEFARLEKLKGVCIDNGICPNCGGEITATSPVIHYGLFNHKKFNSSNVYIKCRNCGFFERSWPIEAIHFEIIYK